MNKPDELFGFTAIDGEQYSFEFDHAKFSLRLYPAGESGWKRSKQRQIHDLFDLEQLEDPSWIGEEIIHADTADGNAVEFCISQNRSMNNGLIVYPVNWYYYHYPSFALDDINGITIRGGDICYFYNPNRILKKTLTYEQGRKTAKEVAVSAEHSSASCGTYRIAKNLDAAVTVNSYAIMRHWDYSSPLSGTSSLTLSFSDPCNLGIAVKGCRHIRALLMYLTYRTNVSFEAVDVFRIREDGLRHNDGILAFSQQSSSETHSKASSRVIPQHLLKRKTSKLMTLIKNGNLRLYFLCDSIDRQSEYTPARCIMILSQFEREFGLIYGDEIVESQSFNDVKNDILALLENYRETQTGSRKKRAKSFIRYIENQQERMSFQQMTNRALRDCANIIEPFVAHEYSGFKPEIRDDISHRIADVRNGIAHNKLSFDFDPVHINDIKTVEKLLYAMRLKHIGLTDDECKQAIAGLFDVNISL